MITTKKYISTIVIAVLLIGGSFFYGMKLGQKGYIYSGHDFKIINENQAPKDVDYSLLWQTLDIINRDYIDKPVDQQKVLYGAIHGAVNALGDPYTTFFDPTEYNDFKTELAGSFEGIGAEVGIKDNHVIIVSPLDGSPAKNAGVKPGDVILKINSEDATHMTLDQAVAKIRGPKGTQVTLTLLRNGAAQPFTVTITRQTINVNSVKYSVKNDNGKKIEDIEIDRFGDDTLDLFRAAAIDAQKNNVSGIILDLRDDPGGYLDTAVSIASYWVDQGKTVVTEAHSNPADNKTYTATGNNVFKNMPTVVLFNNGSASAAEILSGALHDYGFAKTVGVKSFGKGSVQQLEQLPYGTALKVTVAKWLTPNGININHNGLDPDFKVDRSPDQIQANQDPQMDKALELLK